MDIALIILMIVGVLMIPSQKKQKRDRYSDEVLEIIGGRLTTVDLRYKKEIK